jgi:hypothetical protein
MPNKGWKREPARHALASKGVSTSNKLRKFLKLPLPTKPKITGTAHDWVELRFNGRNYELTPKYDFIFDKTEDSYEAWQKEMKELKTMTMAQIRRKYHVTEID